MKDLVKLKEIVGPVWRLPVGVQEGKFPDIAEPVLAVIERLDELGMHLFREVVYYDGDSWCSYQGSRTFECGEIVLRWIYADECI